MQLPKWLVIVMLGAALVGFADSAYLTTQHIRGVIPPCTVEGCDQVLTSRFASVAGVPVAALGLLYYGTILVLLVAFLDTGNWRILHAAAWLTAVGFLGTLYFVSVQLFVLRSLCIYCMGSALTSTVLFAAGIRVMRTS